MVYAYCSILEVIKALTFASKSGLGLYNLILASVCVCESDVDEKSILK